MPLLGEAPITVYMQKKCKANDISASYGKPPLKKRKIDEPTSSKNTKPDAKVPQAQTSIHDFLTQAGRSNPSIETKTVSQTLSPITPDASHKKTRKMGNAQERLQTPLMTNEGPLRLRKPATVKSTPFCIEPLKQIACGKGLKSYTTPLTMPRHSFRTHGFHCSDDTPCKRTTGHQFLEATKPAPELIQHVPSSQSQPELTLKAIEPPMHDHSSRKDPDFPLNGQQATMYSPTDSDYADILVVESSQSQLPLVLPEHITRSTTNLSRTDKHRSAQDPIFFECIPSSQSQEIELTIPESEVHNSPLKYALPSPQLASCTINATGQTILRTFSDETFSVPIQYGLLDDIFEREGEEGSEQKGGISRPSENIADESATESDSQYEYPIGRTVAPDPELRPPSPDNSNQSGHSPQNPGNVCPAGTTSSLFSQEYGHDEPQGEDFLPFPNSISQPADASQESSPSGSLPSDIRALFGNSQDSYPPDFPSSLR